MGNYSLSHRQKRLIVRGRLAELDAGSMSDRAIARELNVSQPFVSALRRELQPSEDEEENEENERLSLVSERPFHKELEIPEADLNCRTAHPSLDTTPRARWVRQSPSQLDVGRALTNFDPFS